MGKCEVNWISVKERLPEKYGRYLVMRDDSREWDYMGLDLIMYNPSCPDHPQLEGWLVFGDRIAYWAELPELPEKPKEGDAG